MTPRFIKTPEKRDIVKELNEKFGITELPYLLSESGKEKIRGFSGHLSKDEILELSQMLNVDNLGLYLMKKERDGLRPGFDATQLLKEQITKNIIEITSEQFELWIRGKDLDIKAPQGTYVVKYKEDLLGCGRSNGEKLFNYVPKERRIKKALKQEII